MAEKEIKVGIGDMKFIRGEGRIITYALGSCIGVTFYDPFYGWVRCFIFCCRSSVIPMIQMYISMRIPEFVRRSVSLRPLEW